MPSRPRRCTPDSRCGTSHGARGVGACLRTLQPADGFRAVHRESAQAAWLDRKRRSAAALVELLGPARGIVMRGNGAVTVGASIEEALVMAWYLEDAARVELAVL